MDLGNTVDTDSNISKSSSFHSPQKQVKDVLDHDIETLKKIHRKRRKVTEWILQQQESLVIADDYPKAEEKPRQVQGVRNKIFSDYITPKIKFVPTKRPDRSKMNKIY